MTDPAGTPDPKVVASDPAPTPPADPKDSKQVTVSEQFKKEALENWKPAAERVNKLEGELTAERAKSEQLARLAYGGGQAATDPATEAYNAALAQAEFDPVARLAVTSAQKVVRAEAEQWLTNELDDVEGLSSVKRKQAAALIRANGYQMSVDTALSMVTDPETKTLQQQLAETQAELNRLKGAKSNGISPAAVTPASSDADEGRTQETIDRADYIAALTAARQPNANDAVKARARTLMEAVGSNKTRFKT